MKPINCEECGKPIDTNQKSCQLCVGASKNRLGWIVILLLPVWILAGAIGRMLGGTEEAMALTVMGVLFTLSFSIGWLLARWRVLKKSPSIRLLSMVTWLNVAAWIFPVLGAFICGFTIRYSNPLKKAAVKFRYIAYAGGILSLLNAIAGTLLTLFNINSA